MIRATALLVLVGTAAAADSCNATTTPTSFLGRLVRGFRSPAVKPVLRYFNIRGRAEVIRMALADAGIEFEDHSFTGDEWGKGQPDGLKANWTSEGRLAFGQVPLLEIDGLQLVQSHSILRYLGRKLKWYVGDAATLAKIDVIADGTEDVRKMLSAIRYAEATPTEKDEMIKKYFWEADKGKMWMRYFEKLVAASKTEFVAGTQKPTHADYLLFDLLDLHDSQSYRDDYGIPVCANRDGYVFTQVLLTCCPSIRKWRETMRARPKLKAYFESPARRDKPCDGKGNQMLDVPPGQVY